VRESDWFFIERLKRYSDSRREEELERRKDLTFIKRNTQSCSQEEREKREWNLSRNTLTVDTRSTSAKEMCFCRRKSTKRLTEQKRQLERREQRTQTSWEQEWYDATGMGREFHCHSNDTIHSILDLAFLVTTMTVSSSTETTTTYRSPI
jgi:hypothetical protein